MQMRLKQEILDRVRGDELLQARIAEAMNRKVSTIRRWITQNSVWLTTQTVQDLICRQFKLSKKSQIVSYHQSTRKAVLK